MGTILKIGDFSAAQIFSKLLILLDPQVGLESSIKRIFNNMQVSG